MWRRGLVPLIALLVACSSDDQTCAAYACINEVRITGTVSLPTMPAAVDASFCSEGRCHTGTIDLTTGAESCAQWDLSGVCLKPASDAFLLTAVWATGED